MTTPRRPRSAPGGAGTPTSMTTPPSPTGPDLALLRGHALPRTSSWSRRSFLRSLGAAAGLGATSVALAACGIKGTNPTGSEPQVDWTAWWAKQKINGHFTFDNWAAYIDSDDNGHYPTLEAFTKKTGIKVRYNDAAVADPASYYGKISPALAARKPIGADLFVITNGWEFTQLVEKGWVAQLDHSRMPNFMKYANAAAASPAYDFDATHSAVWQSGYTGIAYHSDMIDGEIESWADLTKPEYQGKVTMFSDLDELAVTGMLATGSRPEDSGEAEWRKAAKWLTDELRPNVKKFYDQGYLDAFKAKQMPITQAWSGDILAIQADDPKVRFVFPKEGFAVWHDNMMIPVTARNPLDALTWIDHYYQPSVAATVEDYIWYLSPVDGVKDYIAKVIKDTDYTDSPLAFPSAEVLKNVHEYPVHATRSEYDAFTAVFQPVVQG